MRFKKVIILLSLLSLWGGTMIFANTATQKVKTIINDAVQEESGVVIDGKTYLPVRQLANAFQSILEWDNVNKKATIYKPNVHMFLFKDNEVFGNVNRGYQGKFKVFAQVDSMKTSTAAVKVTITDPYGKETVIQESSVNTKNDNFWFVTENIEYKFEHKGDYPIRFYMKVKSSDDWTSVSEKMIISM